jgi:hypothetical protein
MEFRTTPASSRILDLPTELRLMVFAYLGCSDTAPLLYASDGIFLQDDRRHPNLLQLCHTITFEITDMVLAQQRLSPVLSLSVELGEPLARLPNILRMIEAGENRGDVMYKAHLSSYPSDTKVHGMERFYRA